MLGILWLTVWITVGQALYDEYWYTSQDGAPFSEINWQRHFTKENFSEALRNFAESINIGQDDPISISNAKLKLRSIKVYDYTGSSNDFDSHKGQMLPLPEGSKFCTMGRHTKVDCNHCTCVGGQLYLCTGMICPESRQRPESVLACREGTKRQIDSCNFCFCRSGRELCTTKDCGQKHQSLRTKCKEGSQRIVNTCNRCICIHGEEYCSNKICEADEKMPPEIEFKIESRNGKNGTCAEGSRTEIDACNYCLCQNGAKYCTQKSCQDNAEEEFSESCEENSKWTKGLCNECICSDGDALCTENTCKSSLRSISGLSAAQRKQLKPGCFQCEGGDDTETTIYGCENRFYCYWFACVTICHDVSKENQTIIKEPHPVLVKEGAGCSEILASRICDTAYMLYEENRCVRHYVCKGKKECMVITGDSDDCHGLNKAPRPKPDSCAPDTSKKIDCNTCTCKDSRWVCTTKKCNEKNRSIEYADNELITPEKEKCLTGTTQVVHCNTCRCVDGQWVCTLLACPPSINKEGKKHKKRECKSGSTTKVNCNTCLCLDGRWLCTLIACPSKKDKKGIKQKPPKRKECITGSNKKVHCNTCSCIKSQWLCTLKGCSPSKYTEDFQSKKTKCKSGSTTKVNCNTCYCYNDQWFCTLLECPPEDNKIVLWWAKSCKKDKQKFFTNKKSKKCYACECTLNRWICIPTNCDLRRRRQESNELKIQKHSKLEDRLSLKKQECRIGTTKNLDCNKCFCFDGNWVCTLKSCRTKKSKKHAVKKLEEPKYKRCKPGTIKKDNCNTCSCVDGEWRCTLLLCEKIKNPAFNKLKPRKKKKCRTGTTRKLHCNTCRCFSGKWLCTLLACPEENKDLLRSECQSGSTKRDDCNYCICFNDGKWKCSRITGTKCMAKYPQKTESSEEKMPQVSNESEISMQEVDKKPQKNEKCQSGTTKIEDNCYYCICFNNGKWKCSRMGARKCIPDKKPKKIPENIPKNPKEPENSELESQEGQLELSEENICETGAIIKFDCHICTCHDNEYVCTDIICLYEPETQVSKKPNKKPPKKKRCRSGQTKMVKCNTCTCYNGGWMCTLLACPPQSKKQKKEGSANKKKKCRHGELKEEKCDNYCECVNGMWLCTDFKCGWELEQLSYLRSKTDLDEELIRNQPECQYDEIKYDNCNLCTCNAHQWVCEENTCDIYDESSESESLSIEKESCQKGDKRTLDACYECYCVHNKWVCENLNCEDMYNTEEDDYDMGKCQDGDTLKIDSCYECKCLYGDWICENNNCETMELLDNATYPDFTDKTKLRNSQQKCKPGALKYKDCNRCICLSHQWVCELNQCEQNIEFETQKKVCEYYEVKYEKCNQCVCRHNQWVCEKKTCNYDELFDSESSEEYLLYLESCKTNDKRKLDACNKCYCYNGQWFCENRKCGILEILASTDDAEFDHLQTWAAQLDPVCSKEKSRQIDACNFCYCRKGQWFCENKLCGRDIDESLLYLQTCQNEDQRKLDLCNKCYCRSGQWFCENKECGVGDVPGIELSNIELLSSKSPVCKQGRRRKMDDCNYCYCSNGQWFCENQPCDPPPPAEPDRPVFLKQTLFVCNTGEILELNCRFCSCEDGGWVCKQKTKCSNSDADLYLRSESCSTGYRMRLDACNYCYCNSDNKIICSKHKCNNYPYDSGRLRTSQIECTEGTKRSYDHCNYCVCIGGLDFCTQKSCLNYKSSPLISEPSCKPGEVLPSPDSCNECICINSDIACTNYECLQPKRGLRNSYKCTEGTRRTVDHCNFCLCHDKEEFCTQRVCITVDSEPQLLFPESQCELGESIPDPDPCNECICIENDIACTTISCPEKYGLRTSSKCTNGTRTKVEECNYCECINGVEYCTNKTCTTNTSKPLPKYLIPGPKCEAGTALPKDSCNECMCRNNEVMCTKKSCAEETTGAKRSSLCVEGRKRNLDDGCNFCVCRRGQEFCTSRACLSTNFISTNTNCNEGEVTIKDKCNMCLCLQGKLTCTDNPCNEYKRTGSRMSPSNSKRISRYMIQAPKTIKLRPQFEKKKTRQGKICTHGNIYKLEDDDPNCPNTCVCDNNEILCTKRVCKKHKKRKRGHSLYSNWKPKSFNVDEHGIQFLKQEGCIENERLASDDPCNTCICHNGRKVCTILTCADNEDTMIGMTEDELLTGKKGKNRSHIVETKKDASFCTPFTFYSPDNNRFCRNCFCLHNGLALCLLNLCKYSKDIPHNPPIAPLQATCTPGETGYPTKCVTCTCSKDAKWICLREDLEICQDRDCDAKDEFQMGMEQSCASCKCAVKEWYCSIHQQPCSDYSEVKCPIGTFIRNPKQPCSVCVCGGNENNSNNLCFTELKCVRQVNSDADRI